MVLGGMSLARTGRGSRCQGPRTQVMPQHERRRYEAQLFTAGWASLRLQHISPQPASFGIAKWIHALHGRAGHQCHCVLSPWATRSLEGYELPWWPLTAEQS